MVRGSVEECAGRYKIPATTLGAEWKNRFGETCAPLWDPGPPSTWMDSSRREASPLSHWDTQ